MNSEYLNDKFSIFTQLQTFFKSLSKSEKEGIPCFKESYSSDREIIDEKKVMNKSDIPRAREEMSSYKISSQAQDDFIEFGLNFWQNKGIASVFGVVSDFILKK